MVERMPLLPLLRNYVEHDATFAAQAVEGMPLAAVSQATFSRICQFPLSLGGKHDYLSLDSQIMYADRHSRSASRPLRVHQRTRKSRFIGIGERRSLAPRTKTQA